MEEADTFREPYSAVCLDNVPQPGEKLTVIPPCDSVGCVGAVSRTAPRPSQNTLSWTFPGDGTALAFLAADGVDGVLLPALQHAFQRPGALHGSPEERQAPEKSGHPEAPGRADRRRTTCC
ncbi:hypothetical protein V5799_012954 [Amblyomma americanum]|uniref:Uncharacterized protein n=1 Tax=Amblyomma americanum TaxID=6943 RepID=A0AAQ4E7H8_AMBAM